MINSCKPESRICSQIMNDNLLWFVFQLMSPSTALSIPESERHTAQRLTAVLDAKVKS